MPADAIAAANHQHQKAGLTLKTNQLFLLLALASVGIAWAFNTHVMTRDVYHTLLGGQLGADRIDHYFDLLQRRSVWSLAMVPVLVLLRVGLVSLTTQLVLLLWTVEVHLATLFRVSLWAFAAPLIDSAARTWSLATLDAWQVGQAALAASPGSLAQWLLPADEQGPLRIVLLPLSLTELAWGLIMILALREATGVSWGRSVAVVLAVWALITLCQVTVGLYLVGL